MSESPAPELPKIGRPSLYCEELAETICDRIADGESLRSICAADEMPAKGTVMRWLKKEATFQDHYAQARARQTEGMADDILEIADDTSQDTEYGDNGPKANAEWISRSRLRVDARLKLMALLNPKKYGKKLALEVTDERTPRQLSDAELAEIAAADSE